MTICWHKGLVAALARAGSPRSIVEDRMAKGKEKNGKKAESELTRLMTERPSAVADTRVIYCGDNLNSFGGCRRGVRI